MRILFVGDVMGNVGQTAVTTYLPKLKRRYKPQVTIVNGENATRGRGINQEVYKDILTAGLMSLRWATTPGIIMKFLILLMVLRS